TSGSARGWSTSSGSSRYGSMAVPASKDRRASTSSRCLKTCDFGATDNRSTGSRSPRAKHRISKETREWSVLEPQTPEWVRDAIFYQIFPDRFARSLSVPKPRHLDEWGAPPTYHGYQGGDLIGVVEHLDYLIDLGINAIYFTPVFQSASNH